MKQSLIIVCDSVILEQVTEKVSLIGIFDYIYPNKSKLPVQYNKFSVFTRFEDGIGEHPHEILIKHEDGEEIVKLNGKINFNKNKIAQYVGNFFDLFFPRLGIYKIEIRVDDMLYLTGNIEVRDDK